MGGVLFSIVLFILCTLLVHGAENCHLEGGWFPFVCRWSDGTLTTLFKNSDKKRLEATNDVACISVQKKHLFDTLAKNTPHSAHFP